MRLEDDKTNPQILNGNSGSSTSGAEENSKINKYSSGMENPSEDSRGLERSTSRDKNKRMSLETNETNETNPQKVPRGKETSTSIARSGKYSSGMENPSKSSRGTEMVTPRDEDESNPQMVPRIRESSTSGAVENNTVVSTIEDPGLTGEAPGQAWQAAPPLPPSQGVWGQMPLIQVNICVVIMNKTSWLIPP